MYIKYFLFIFSLLFHRRKHIHTYIPYMPRVIVFEPKLSQKFIFFSTPMSSLYSLTLILYFVLRMNIKIFFACYRILTKMYWYAAVDSLLFIIFFLSLSLCLPLRLLTMLLLLLLLWLMCQEDEWNGMNDRCK